MFETHVYLDHAATTPLDPRVLEEMRPYFTDCFGNPSSLHQYGKTAQKALLEAREKLASLLGAHPDEILYTSGGTESDNLAILGVTKALLNAGKDRGRHILVSAIEHPAVLEPCRYLEESGWRITHLPVDTEGFIHPETLRQAIRPGETVLASIMHGNNEIGTVQNIAALGDILREYDILFHTDAVQTVGALPIDLSVLPVDYLSLSGHKFYAPKGIGALYVRRGACQPVPLLYGGGQESGLRSGTENLPAIVGLAEALSLCAGKMSTESTRLHELQRYFIDRVRHCMLSNGITAALNGPEDLNRRLPGNVNFSFPPFEGESLVLRLAFKGIAVSSGSACHSEKIEPSHVVLALGKSSEIARSTLRFSFGRTTTQEDLERTVSALSGILQKLTAKEGTIKHVNV